MRNLNFNVSSTNAVGWVEQRETHRCQFKKIFVCFVLKSVAKWKHLLHNVENSSNLILQKRCSDVHTNTKLMGLVLFFLADSALTKCQINGECAYGIHRLQEVRMCGWNPRRVCYHVQTNANIKTDNKIPIRCERRRARLISASYLLFPTYRRVYLIEFQISSGSV